MNRKKKVLLLSVACLLLSPCLSAQGLFGNPSTGDNYQGGRSLLSPGNSSGVWFGDASQEYPTLDPLNTGLGFGGASQEDPNSSPLGSGMFTLIAAGVSYVLMKRKEEKQ